ncbi:unnamed protein product [Lactuca saligna]|uniref:Helitron helicase-like domain-containing protein n=1 Tax=Lactuca saligna TaxID=75948 RepID=A0AA35Z3Z0_LACSI|nr:unnamed protein product [Lactuca saligna]
MHVRAVYDLAVAGDATSTSVVPYVQVAHAARRGRRPGRMRLLPDLPQYVDLGDSRCVCKYCGAFFWFSERSMKLSMHNHPRYSHCCRSGEVVLPYPSAFPPEYISLFGNDSNLRDIRAYNSMFSMTSFGATVDDELNNGRGPYVFKVSGQISHQIGSLCPDAVKGPRFLQLYLFDIANEVQNRYDLPTPGSLGCIVTGDAYAGDRYDIVIHSNTGRPQRISKLHPTYMPLNYLLLFPYREPGWCPAMRLGNRTDAGAKNLTLNMYYAYHLHGRQYIWYAIFNSSRLENVCSYQHLLLVVHVTCIEDSHLQFYATHQETLRSEYVGGLYDALSKGDRGSRSVGKRVFLPTSFTGGPCYMYSHYQDALAICRLHGNPQYFITFTCNVKWPEITRYMDMHDQRDSQSRTYIIARVFQLKVQSLINYLKQDKPFGEIDAYRVRYVIPKDVGVNDVGPSKTVNEQPNVMCEEKQRIDEIKHIWMILSVHEENNQSILFKEDTTIIQVLRNPSATRATLLAWFESNAKDPTGHEHTYIDYPKYYKWDAPSKSWDRRAAV